MPFIERPAGRLFYQFDGPVDRPVVMLSNSLGTDHGLWDPQVPELAKRYRVLRYDNRGHGRSDEPTGPLTIADLGGDVVTLLDALGLERVTFMGLSIGGMIGMWLGANAAPRIERLVLCNTSAYLGNPDLWNQRIAAVRQGGLKSILPSVIERWFTPGFRASNPQAIEKTSRMMLATKPSGYIALCEAIRDMDQRASIGAIRAPTLVICGSQDVATTPTNAKAIVDAVAGARLVTLEAAHISNVEQANRFTAAVTEFLGR